MHRRQALKCGCGLFMMAKLQSASATDTALPYTREIYEEALASGKPFMLDFYATW